MVDARRKQRIAGAALAGKERPELADKLGSDAKKLAESKSADELREMAHPSNAKARRDGER